MKFTTICNLITIVFSGLTFVCLVITYRNLKKIKANFDEMEKKT